MLHQPIDLRGEYLANYRCVGECQKLDISIKVVYFMQLSDALIMQINIFKYIDGFGKTFIPNLMLNHFLNPMCGKNNNHFD